MLNIWSRPAIHMPRRAFLILYASLWLVLLTAVYFSYRPGLTGDFVFDDYGNIVNNPQLNVTAWSAEEIFRVATSGNAGPLGRPIAVLTFALNVATAGLDPWYFKLTNVIIHLASVGAVGWLGFGLFRAWGVAGWSAVNSHITPPTKLHPIWSALIVAALWGMHPINLTGVLYVVQRMTSLSALFGITSMALYVSLRTHDSCTNPRRPWKHSFAYLTAAGLWAASVLSKEGGVLFVPLLIWIEYYLFGFKIAGRPLEFKGHEFRGWFGWALVSVATAGSLALLAHYFTPAAFSTREFTPVERILTETRVICAYLQMLVFPQVGIMSLYHDDIPISISLWEPISTAWATAFLIITTIILWLLRRKWPGLTFVWGWFLICHALESTFFPLELMHEHRNYIASVALAFLVAQIISFGSSKNTVITKLFVGWLLIALLSTLTMLRAIEWSNPLLAARIEAERHPSSMRANYELGRQYLLGYERGYLEQEQAEQAAMTALERARNALVPSIAPNVALLIIGSGNADKYSTKAERADWLQELIDRLKTLPFQNGTMSHLQSLQECKLQGKCDLGDLDILAVLTAPLDNPTAPPSSKRESLKVAAQYAATGAHDWAMARRMIEEALLISEDSPGLVMYAQVLKQLNFFDDAEAQLMRAAAVDVDRRYAALINEERKSLRNTRNSGNSENSPNGK